MSEECLGKFTFISIDEIIPSATADYAKKRTKKRNQKTTETVIYCDECKLPFPNLVQLLDHVDVHRELICGICQRTYKFECDLYNHMLTHRDLLQNYHKVLNEKVDVIKRQINEKISDNIDVVDSFISALCDNDSKTNSVANSFNESNSGRNKMKTKEEVIEADFKTEVNVHEDDWDWEYDYDSVKIELEDNIVDTKDEEELYNNDNCEGNISKDNDIKIIKKQKRKKKKIKKLRKEIPNLCSKNLSECETNRVDSTVLVKTEIADDMNAIDDCRLGYECENIESDSNKYDGIDSECGGDITDSKIVESNSNNGDSSDIVKRSKHKKKKAKKMHNQYKEFKRRGRKPSDRPPKVFQCDLCSYKASKMWYIENHLRVHSGEKPFACNECEFRCKQRGGLTIHMNKHKEGCEYTCNVCDYKTKTLGLLKSHQILHDDKNISCEVCGKLFRRISNLKDHMKCHSEERPYRCSQCTFSSKDGKSLKRHILKHNCEGAV